MIAVAVVIKTDVVTMAAPLTVAPAAVADTEIVAVTTAAADV